MSRWTSLKLVLYTGAVAMYLDFRRNNMTGTFQKCDRQQLEKWVGGQKKFNLLYKATRDGCNADTFHNKCNNKGPTVTLFYNSYGTVFGGYNPKSWSNAGNVMEPKAFIFRLRYNDQIKPVQRMAKQWAGYEYSICDNATYGPSFGFNSCSNNYDLRSFSGKLNLTNGSYYQMNGNWNLSGHAYNMQGENFNSLANATNQVTEIEVYDVQERTPNDPLEEPWRRTKIWENRYRMYNVRNGGTGRAMNFRLCDTRGLEEDQGLDSHEVCYLLDGNIPDKYMFNPSVPVSSEVAGFVSCPKLKDRIHVVAFVVDATTVDVMQEKVLERMKSLQVRMNQRGVPQVVLLTKIDQICEPLSHNVSNVFHMPAVQECVDKVSHVMGLPRAHVLPVKNYESEMELDENINILALLTLQQILHFADDYLYNFLDEIEEEDS